MSPQRIQIRRVKGWRLPEGAVTVARPSKYGNPFKVDGDTEDWMTWTAVALGYRGDRDGRTRAAVALHRGWMTNTPVRGLPRPPAVGGSIEYDDGSTATLDDICQGFAVLGMSLYEAPTMPPRPDLEPLRGHDLACWCKPGEPCHADALIDLANR